MADYDAFISYSHALDKPVASALQAAIQRLGKPWYRRRGLRIFRDDTSLSATPHLWPSIEQALAQSRYLILLASPQSATSHWCGKEIAYWLDHKSVETFLIAVTDGEVGWDGKAGDFVWSETTPLPPVVKGKFNTEPKWVDLRDYRQGSPDRKDRFIDLAADLAATVHGIPKEDLLSQEVRQQRRALTLAWSAAATLLVLASVAGWQWHIAAVQRAKAENALTAATGTADRLVFDMAVDLRNHPGMPVDTVVRILGGMQAMQDELSQAGNATPELRRHQAAALAELSTTLLTQGALSTAKSDAEHAVAIMQDLLKLDPANAQYQRDLAVNLNKLGDAHLRLRDFGSALDLYNQALAISATLAAAASDDGNRQADVVASLSAVAGLQMMTAKPQDALATLQRAAAILAALVAKQPGNLPWQYSLSQTENRIGLISLQTGQSAAALAAYRSGLAIRQKLVAAAPTDTEYQRGLADDYTWTGNLLAKTGAGGDALAAYQNALPIVERLAASDAGNNQWQDELALAYENVGQMLALGGTHDQALDHFQKGLAIRQRLATGNPDNTTWQHEVEVSYNNIGDSLIATGKPSDAIAAYQQALAIAQQVATAEPDNTDWQNDLSFCYARFGDVYAGDDRAKARDFYQKSLAIRDKLVAADGDDVQLRRDLAHTHERLATLAAADGATNDARASLRRAVALRRHIAAADANNGQWQYELLTGLLWLAQAGDEPQQNLAEAHALGQKLDAAGKLNAQQKTYIAGVQQALAAMPPSQQADTQPRQ